MAVPTILIDIMQYIAAKRKTLESLKTIHATGTLIPPEVVKRFCKLVSSVENVQIKYGITETSVITQTRFGLNLDQIVDNVGVAVDHMEVKVVNQKTGKLVAIGEEGELVVKGPSVFLGYYNDEIATIKALDKSGWYHTG